MLRAVGLQESLHGLEQILTLGGPGFLISA